MRFLQGKEAERLVRQGVRALTRAEKARLGLSRTNTYYVRADLRRPNRRSAVATSRQVRQARAQLGIITEMAQRVRGRAGRPRKVTLEQGKVTLEQANRDYQAGRISLDEARRQAQEWIERSRSSRQVLTQLLFDGAKKVTWYRKTYRDGTQFVINWENDEYQMTRDVQVERLVRIVDSLAFDLIGYSVFEKMYGIGRDGNWQLLWSGWVSSLTVDRERAEADAMNVRRGETEGFDSVHLFYILFLKKPSVSAEYVELTVRLSYFLQ